MWITHFNVGTYCVLPTLTYSTRVHSHWDTLTELSYKLDKRPAGQRGAPEPPCDTFSLDWPVAECDEHHPCQGLGEHAHFRSFGMAFLTLFRIATGDNWNGIMKDTLREECEDGDDCLRNCCVSPYFAPLFFVVFVLMAQFVLVNVVVAVLMKHLEESHKQVSDCTSTPASDVISLGCVTSIYYILWRQ